MLKGILIRIVIATIMILLALKFAVPASAQCYGEDCYRYLPPQGPQGNQWGYNFYDRWHTPNYHGYWPGDGYYQQYGNNYNNYRYYQEPSPYYYDWWGRRQGPRYQMYPQAGQDHYRW